LKDERKAIFQHGRLGKRAAATAGTNAGGVGVPPAREGYQTAFPAPHTRRSSRACWRGGDGHQAVGAWCLPGWSPFENGLAATASFYRGAQHPSLHRCVPRLVETQDAGKGAMWGVFLAGPVCHRARWLASARTTSRFLVATKS